MSREVILAKLLIISFRFGVFILFWREFGSLVRDRGKIHTQPIHCHKPHPLKIYKDYLNFLNY